MAIIQLPVNPLDEEQLVRKVSILTKVLSPSHKPGLLLYAGLFKENGDAHFSLIQRNLSLHVPKNYVLTLHAPFSAHVPTSKTNLAYSESLDTFGKAIQLAEEISASSITLHIGTNFYPESGRCLGWPIKSNNDKNIEKMVVEPAFYNLLELARKTKIKISIENIPLPLKGNKTTDPSQIIYEPLLVTFESIKKFFNFFEGVPNVGLCLDTAHYGIAKETLNKLIGTKDHLDNRLLCKAGFGPIYPERARLQPGWNNLIKEIMMLGGSIFDVQLSDYGKTWEPAKGNNPGQLLEEGLGILEGKGSIELLVLGKEISSRWDTPISFDIEVNDFLNPYKQISSVLMFQDYLANEKNFRAEYIANRLALIERYGEYAKKTVNQITMDRQILL